MSERVVGEYRHSVGANRVRIPSKYRMFIGDIAYASPGSDGCFLLYPKENEKLVIGRYDDDPHLSVYKDFARYLDRNTFIVEIDVQGRLTISAELKKICEGMADATEVVFCGRGDYIEAWPSQVYDRLFGEKEDNLDEMIAALKAKLKK